MDAKITLSFNESVIIKAKRFAESNNISLSRLIEFILAKITSENYASLEDFPISDWVNSVAEGDAEYHIRPKKNKDLRSEYHKRKK